MINPFKNRIKVNIIEKRQEEITLLGRLARTCLSNDDFKEYRIKYEELKATIIETILEYQESDPVIYSINMRNLTAQLKILNKMIPDIEKDAKIEAINAV